MDTCTSFVGTDSSSPTVVSTKAASKYVFCCKTKELKHPVKKKKKKVPISAPNKGAGTFCVVQKKIKTVQQCDAQVSMGPF